MTSPSLLAGRTVVIFRNLLAEVLLLNYSFKGIFLMFILFILIYDALKFLGFVFFCFFLFLFSGNIWYIFIMIELRPDYKKKHSGMCLQGRLKSDWASGCLD